MDIQYEELSNLLIQEIPELTEKYRKELEWWEDEEPGPHNIYGDVLNPYLLGLLRKDNQNKKLKKVFSFIEELANSNSKKVQEVVAVTVLERLSTEPDLLKKAEKYMGPKTMQFLGELKEFWKSK